MTFRNDDQVAFDIGGKTIVGTLTKPYAQDTKFGVMTDRGEYTMMLADIRHRERLFEFPQDIAGQLSAWAESVCEPAEITADPRAQWALEVTERRRDAR